MNRGLRAAGWMGVLVVAGACGEKTAGSGYGTDKSEATLGSAKAREESKAAAATASPSAFAEDSPDSVYEGALPQGEAVARTASETWRIPLEVLRAEPTDHAAWLAAARVAVDRLLGL